MLGLRRCRNSASQVESCGFETRLPLNEFQRQKALTRKCGSVHQTRSAPIKPIWVPLGKQTWNWSGEADYGGQNCSGGSWCLIPGSVGTAQSPTILGQALPQDEPTWAGVFSNH